MFELSREHEDFRQVVRDFAEKENGPHVAGWDTAHHFPVDVVRKAGAAYSSGAVRPITPIWILTIGDGTSEVQRMLIARGLGLPVE